MNLNYQRNVFFLQIYLTYKHDDTINVLINVIECCNCLDLNMARISYEMRIILCDSLNDYMFGVCISAKEYLLDAIGISRGKIFIS